MKTVSTLKSRKDVDIIECLLQSVEVDDVIYHTQEDWLREVTKDNPNCPIDWNNPRSISFAILNLSASGQRLNVKKLEEEGIDDFIGIHFPKFKDNPKYSPYPNNYVKKMTHSIYKDLNGTFNTMPIETAPKNIEDILEGRKFNVGFLEKCRRMSEVTGKKQQLIIALNRRQRRAYGRLIKDNLQAIDVRQVHPPGKKLYNQLTGKLEFVNGLQIRDGIPTEENNVLNFTNLISRGQWDATCEQMMVILLPEEYQYIDPLTGVKVIYGILDGNHRFKASILSFEEFIFAWVIEMDLAEIYEFGNAYCNRELKCGKPRTHKDMAKALVLTVNNVKSDLHHLCKATKEKGYKGKSVEDIIVEKLEVDYELDGRSIPSVWRLFSLNDEHDYTPDMKPYVADQMTQWVADNRKSWTPLSGFKDSERIYTDGENTIFIVYQEKGDNVNSVIYKRAVINQLYPEKFVKVICCPDNTRDYSAEDLEQWAIDSRKKYNDRINLIGELRDHLQKDDTPADSFSRLPVSKSLDKDWSKLIRV